MKLNTKPSAASPSGKARHLRVRHPGGVPVERRREVVGEHLVGVGGVDGPGELRGVVEIGGLGLHPEQIGVGREREAPGGRVREAAADGVVALGRAGEIAVPVDADPEEARAPPHRCVRLVLGPGDPLLGRDLELGRPPRSWPRSGPPPPRTAAWGGRARPRSPRTRRRPHRAPPRRGARDLLGSPRRAQRCARSARRGPASDRRAGRRKPADRTAGSRPRRPPRAGGTGAGWRGSSASRTGPSAPWRRARTGGRDRRRCCRGRWRPRRPCARPRAHRHPSRRAGSGRR